MSYIRKKHGSKFKAQTALMATKGQKTVAEIASQQGVHPTQVNAWKKVLLDNIESLYIDRRKARDKEVSTEVTELYEQIGRLKMEIEWLKKKYGEHGK